MGILVTDGILPSGIPVSNVYMSFDSEIIYVSPKSEDGRYTIQAHYKVFKDATKELKPDIRLHIAIQVNDISVGVFQSLYENLKQFYPSSVDC
jgi:hypothetical protein